jgi:putative tryptophan/tyrosine transport system substrate-binding protein
VWYSAVGCIVTLILGLLTAPTAQAQPPAQVARIGYLVTGGLASPETRVLLDAFRQGLRERGYVEGQNIVIEYRAADGQLERFPALAAELVQLKPEVIVAQGTPAALAAQHATTTIPIVTPVMGDPVGDGLVASLARPGGNITGLTFLGPELVAKRLELLKEALPRVSRIAALWHPGAYAEGTTRTMVQETEAAARTLGVRLQLVEVRGPDEFDRAFATMTSAHAEALIVLPSAMLFNERRRLVDLAARHRLPAMYQLGEFVELGGLMAYGASITDLIRRSATHVDKILKGAKPADLPVEQPTKFELVINLQTAKALGLTMPPTLLFQADKVIQ